MLYRGSIIVALVLVILGVPYALRPPQRMLPSDAPLLTLLSPHNEAIRFEFERAFSDWHKEHYGQPVRMDWRSIGGTSKIAQFLESEYVAAFRNVWTNELHRPWSADIESGFANRKLDPENPPEGTPPEVVEARKAFLASDIGIGVDIFFGGGWYDHNKQAVIGNTVPCGIAAEHPELLREEIMPRLASGEILYDKKDRYYGCCLTCFGICYNRDALRRLGLPGPPAQWRDLADPRYFGQIGLADPTKSGSSTKAFEMLIQQQIMQEIARREARKLSSFQRTLTSAPKGIPLWVAHRFSGGEHEFGRRFTSASHKQWTPSAQAVGHPGFAHRSIVLADAQGGGLTKAEMDAAVAAGFWRGMGLIQLISANSRYFTNTSSKVPIDVVQGDAAAGMCIDFYGRFEAGMVAQQTGRERMGYVTPVGGSSVSADPISLLRGAPHKELAKRFIYFCLTKEGQKLWYYRVGTPGGPIKYALRRLPIRKDLYTPEHRQYASDPNVKPYELAEAFNYNHRWTARLFDFIRLFIRTMGIDTHEELTEAWHAILAAGGPEACPEAFARMQTMPLTYAEAFTLTLRDKLEAVQLAREWDAHFRANYLAARDLARRKGVAAR